MSSGTVVSCAGRSPLVTTSVFKKQSDSFTPRFFERAAPLRAAYASRKTASSVSFTHTVDADRINPQSTTLAGA